MAGLVLLLELCLSAAQVDLAIAQRDPRLVQSSDGDVSVIKRLLRVLRSDSAADNMDRRLLIACLPSEVRVDLDHGPVVPALAVTCKVCLVILGLLSHACCNPDNVVDDHRQFRQAISRMPEKECWSGELENLLANVVRIALCHAREYGIGGEVSRETCTVVGKCVALVVIVCFHKHILDSQFFEPNPVVVGIKVVTDFRKQSHAVDSVHQDTVDDSRRVAKCEKLGFLTWSLPFGGRPDGRARGRRGV